MTIEEAVAAACLGAKVLMSYKTEDEMVNDIKKTPFIAGYPPESICLYKFGFDGGGSIRYLTLRTDMSDAWNNLHYHEGNALAREVFPGAFTNAL